MVKNNIDTRGLEKSMRNATRLHRLGQLYRKTVKAEERSYARWTAFLKIHAPRLAGIGAEGRYKAAPR